MNISEVEAKEIIDAVVRNITCIEELDSNNYHKYLGNIEEELSCEATSGISKLVLIPTESDYVIKIPFFGQWHRELDIRTNIYKKEFDEFHSGISKNSNYCEAETIVFKKAKAEGLEEFFAETYKIGNAERLPIYIQMKASVGVDESTAFNNLSAKEMDALYDYISDNYCFDSLDACWIKDFIEAYGENQYFTLIDFLEANMINDLHDGNVGYSNGRPILIDYSGFEG